VIGHNETVDLVTQIDNNLSAFTDQGAPNVLITFGGLPGARKTTVAQTLACKLAAAKLLIRSSEQLVGRS
jgi:adenylylsulfate kinase-like enzyme